MKIKRWIALVLTAVMAVSVLTACGGSSGASGYLSNNEVNALLDTAGSDVQVVNNSTLNNAVRNAAAEVASSGSTSSVNKSVQNAMGWKISDILSNAWKQFLGSLGIIVPNIKVGMTAVVTEEELKNNTGAGLWGGNTTAIAPVNTPEKFAAAMVLGAGSKLDWLSDISENRISTTYSVAGSKATTKDGTVYWIFAIQIQLAV